MIALLARVSTQEQATNGYSIGEQLDRMRAYCKAMNWTAYKEYIDAGYSGANTNRPALQRMIRDIRAGKVDKVLVYKLDRLSRSQKDTLELIEDVFLANGCDFVSMSENFDTSTPLGRAMIGILAVFAQLEREQIKDRMMLGIDARAKTGKFHGSRFSPIGYDYINGELVVNPYEAMQIKRIFTGYSQGMSPYALARELNEAGLHHKTGIWRFNTIRAIIKKQTYIGYIKHRGEWIKGTHEPIISHELFEKVQDEIKRRSEEHSKHNRRAGKATTYLGGYIVCGCCQAKYSKIKQRTTIGGKQYIYEYYKCNSRTKKRKELIKDPDCNNKTWSVNELDSLVFGEIKKLAVDPKYYEKAVDSMPDDRPDIIRQEMKKIDGQLSRLMDLYTIGQMPLDILQEKISGLSDQKKRLESELDRISQEIKDRLSMDSAMSLAMSFDAVLDYGDFDEIRAVIGSLIDKIEIHQEDISIYWTFS